MTSISARWILERLKQGVPPVPFTDGLSVGMSELLSRLEDLLLHDANPRWFLVQSEYGEGKSHFHALARQHALQAGYAVASLDVNGNDGALHQPQRHLAVVLNSLRSPLPIFCGYQGFVEIFRHWLDTTDRKNAGRILRRLNDITPGLPAGRDPGDLFTWVWYFANASEETDVSKQWYYPPLLRYFSTEDLTDKATYARRTAYFRFQAVQQWLSETGHKGLFLFIDEVDNIVRQIHGRAHAGCFRTLAWYCTSPAYPDMRVVFASTPELVRKLNQWGRYEYLLALHSQCSVHKTEELIYEEWSNEAERLSSNGWSTCPKLTGLMRIVLFNRIAALHQKAWNWSLKDSDVAISELAARSDLRTTRRWVRACVQLLDTIQQARMPGSPG